MTLYSGVAVGCNGVGRHLSVALEDSDGGGSG
jgi:hypothetical protein